MRYHEKHDQSILRNLPDSKNEEGDRLVPFFYIQNNIKPNIAHQISTLGVSSHTALKSMAVYLINSQMESYQFI